MTSLALQTGTENPLLRERAADISSVDDSIRQLGEEMILLMKKKNGIGLAAPQVGISKRIIIAMLKKKPTIMINPRILSFSVDTEVEEEGCLSVPNVFDKVSRSIGVSLEYLDTEGKKKIKNLSHLEARIVQHEIDHLNGVLFVDRVAKKNILVM